MGNHWIKRCRTGMRAVYIEKHIDRLADRSMLWCVIGFVSKLRSGSWSANVTDKFHVLGINTTSKAWDFDDDNDSKVCNRIESAIAWGR